MSKAFERVTTRERKVAEYQRRLEETKNTDHLMWDPVMEPLVAQLQNRLKHVGYKFQIAGNEVEYPYDLPHTDAYPEKHTNMALDRIDRLYRLLDEEEYNPRAIPHFQFEKQLGEQAREKQNEVVRAMLDDPLGTYEEFNFRREVDGDEASFPEMGWTLKALASELTNDYDVQEACEKSRVLHKMRAEHITTLVRVLREGKYPYKDTLYLIEDLMSFFDLVVRVNEPDSPAPYHTANFEYNWHSLSEDSELTLIPTMAHLNLTDLIRLRGIPVALLGVSTNTLTVDGFPQTPYEFFHHDVDHTRRMWLEMVAAVEREGVESPVYYEQSTELMHQLLDAVDLTGFPPKELRTEEQQHEYDRRVARLVTLFEVLHEDAYDCSRDSIADALLRAPLEHTPAERKTGDVVEFYTAPRASLLAHVYRKLAHTFYDLPEKRESSNWTDYARNRNNIAQAAADLYRLVSDDPISDEDLLDSCIQLVSSDEGFTDAFFGNFEHDVKRRAVGNNALRLMVAKPMSVNVAIRRINKIDHADKKIVSLFGYSGLGYEHPDKLEEMVVRDLQELDPEEYAIAIGATPYGIGSMYPVAKDLGFSTLGIVASKALGMNEEASSAVDRIYVVKDKIWGGERYGKAGGLLSPTTRVFLGVSDQINAYGGGDITAVTLKEAARREKPISFIPFEMSHDQARIVKAQHGGDEDIDYSGPAAKAWQDIAQQ